MTELSALTRRIANVEAETKTQSSQLNEAVQILRDVKLALSGDTALGITGIVATAKSAHRRLDEVERQAITAHVQAVKRMEEIEAAAQKERWMGRIGSGVVGAGIAGFCAWLKHKFGIGE